MSSGVDLSEFFDTFFDEADELLANMEQLLLGLDLTSPDSDDLSGIFRAAHSIKGGAGTFGCFEELAHTTHLLENLLDLIRHGEMELRQDMIDIFLETKDVLSDQVAAYRDEQKPDQAIYEQTCARLLDLSHEHEQSIQAEIPDAGGAGLDIVDLIESDDGLTSETLQDQSPQDSNSDDAYAYDYLFENKAAVNIDGGKSYLHLKIANIKESDVKPLSDEMALMGDIVHSSNHGGNLSLWLDTTTDKDDIEAVCCFIVDADQISIAFEPVPGAAVDITKSTSQANTTQVEIETPVANNDNDGEIETSTVTVNEQKTAQNKAEQAAKKVVSPAKNQQAGKPANKSNKPVKHKESSTIRVGVEKVDQMINLVGELVITKAMLAQTSQDLDPVIHDRLLNGIEQLERNARDLQDAVMSIRMVPMEYVFSRFPRVVHENANRLGKKIRLVTEGQATELDKSLIERIIDPLTHLVRNSLDHGIELPDARVAQGKSPEGTLTLSAKHNGGQIIIDVIDDGAGLDRDRIFNKALEQGFQVTESTTDDELWQLIFAPGFSTAKEITDISGRGVGMDVVRRNIQSLGGHVQLSSKKGIGTTTRIVLPLTLAILDGMSVKVGNETFILPLSHVVESMQVSEEQIHDISTNEKVLHVRGEYLPIVALHEVFGVNDAVTNLTDAIAVILKAEDTRYAMIVDHLIGQHQVVVKNLETNYRKVPGISAATILGDGSVALIVDVFALRYANDLEKAITA